MSTGDYATIKGNIASVKILSSPIFIQEYRKNLSIEDTEYSVKVLFLDGEKEGLIESIPESLITDIRNKK